MRHCNDGDEPIRFQCFFVSDAGAALGHFKKFVVKNA